MRRRVRKGWSLVYAPSVPSPRRPRWQPPGKLFDITVFALFVVTGFLAML